MTEQPLSKAAWMEAVLRRYEGPLLRYTAGITGDRERARDVVQEAFLRLCREPRERVAERLAPWLFTVCRNRALDIVKKESRMKPIDERQQALAAGETAPVAVTERREERAQVMDALGKLPGNQQEVIRLKFQSGLSYREISEITGLSTSNVGYLIHVALKTLRGTVKA